MRIPLKDDGWCFVCGAANPDGLRVEFKETNGGVAAYVAVSKRFQGYQDIVHGGIVAALLDEASVKAVLVRGIRAVTAEITLRFRRPFSVGGNAVVKARIVAGRGDVFQVEADLKTEQGDLIASSQAKLIRNGTVDERV